MINGIHPQAVFRTLLKHERSRVDRDGSEFSLAVFQLNGNTPRARYRSFVSSSISDAMRSIDEAGWLEDDRIGVLLPSTNLVGAQRFARRVVEAMPASTAPHVEVYSYPEHWVVRPRGESGSPSLEDGAMTRIDSSTVPAKGGSDPSRSAVFERVFLHGMPAWKRGLDILGAGLGLLVSSPLILAAAIWIKLVSRGPVFLKQQRVGFKGKLFTFVKMRTMKHGNASIVHKSHILKAIQGDLPLAKLDDKGDARIIPGGRVLRKTCIDELPQFLNVLRGDMSLVGPRPCMPYEADEFRRWHTSRFDSYPGMTGLWQVSGKNKLTFNKMIRLDIAYAERLSFWQDLFIILKTVPAIVRMVYEAAAGRANEKKAAATVDGEAGMLSKNTIVS